MRTTVGLAGVRAVDRRHFADFENGMDELPEDERKAIEFGGKSVQSPADVTQFEIDDLKDLGYADGSDREAAIRPPEGWLDTRFSFWDAIIESITI